MHRPCAGIMIQKQGVLYAGAEKRGKENRKCGIDRAADHNGACMSFAFTLHKVVT